jgi:hypothetical protein
MREPDIEFLATEWNHELRLWMNGVERRNLCGGDVLAEAHTCGKRLIAAPGIERHWHQSGQLPAEPDHRVQEIISLMWVLKEAMSNLVRRSGASSARVHIAFRARQLGIVIKDDGRGFDLAVSRTGSRGLKKHAARYRGAGRSLQLPRTGWHHALPDAAAVLATRIRSRSGGIPGRPRGHQLNSQPMPKLRAGAIWPESGRPLAELSNFAKAYSASNRLLPKR